MNIDQVEQLFKSSISSIWDKKKWFLAFFALLACNVLISLARGVGVGSPSWIAMSLLFLPLFLSLSLILCLGVFLGKVYEKEKEIVTLSYKKLFLQSSRELVLSSYVIFFMILAFMVTWMGIGPFFLVKKNAFFKLFFSTLPILGIFGISLILFTAFLAFFLLIPLIVRKQSPLTWWSILKERLSQGALKQVILFYIATTPLFIVSLFSIGAAFVADRLWFAESTSFMIGMEWFLLGLPLSLFMIAPLLFFFHFSLETYRYMISLHN